MRTCSAKRGLLLSEGANLMLTSWPTRLRCQSARLGCGSEPYTKCGASTLLAGRKTPLAATRHRFMLAGMGSTSRSPSEHQKTDAVSTTKRKHDYKGKKMRPDSPCVAVCTTLYDEICKGCGRTYVEVANWVFMTEDEREAVWQRIDAEATAWRYNKYKDRV